MKIDSKIMDGEVWRLITSLFVHGNVAHVAMNSYTLFNFGRQVIKFLKCYSIHTQVLIDWQ